MVVAAMMVLLVVVVAVDHGLWRAQAYSLFVDREREATRVERC